MALRILVAEALVPHIGLLSVPKMKSGTREFKHRNLTLVLRADPRDVFKVGHRLGIAFLGIKRFAHPIVGIWDKFGRMTLVHDLRKQRYCFIVIAAVVCA